MTCGDPTASLSGQPPRWEWALREEESRPFFKRALELGINFFNTAQRVFVREQRGDHGARAARPRAPRGGRHRHLSRKAIFHEIDASLKRLGTDYAAWLPEWKASGLSQLRALAERRPCGGLLAKTSRSARPRSQSHPTDIVIEISAMNLGRLSGASAVPCCM